MSQWKQLVHLDATDLDLPCGRVRVGTIEVLTGKIIHCPLGHVVQPPRWPRGRRDWVGRDFSPVGAHLTDGRRGDFDPPCN